MTVSSANLEQLKCCTVRVDITRDDRGTGFFVAPGLVLTCHHVLKSEATIEIWWQGKTYSANVNEHSEEADLALLQLIGEVPEHPVVQLDLTVTIGDPLYSFGYTDQYVDGDPADFDYVDETGGDWPLMKLDQGQVRPGLSGAPLLNRRTGKVCGVMKKSRDRASDLGGRGIPMTTVFKLFPQLRLEIETYQGNPFTRLMEFTQLSDLHNGQHHLNRIFEILNSQGGGGVDCRQWYG